MRNNIVHELGHVFNANHGSHLYDSIPNVYRFNRDAFLHGNDDILWQVHKDTTSGETFADMFVAYTFGVWQSPIKTRILQQGAPNNPEYWDPPTWMENQMNGWLQ